MKSAEWPAVPALKSHLRVERREPDHVFILDEVTSHLLSGPSYYSLVTLLDGSRTVDEIVEELHEEDPIDLLYALGRLAELGLLTSRRKDVPGPDEVFWDALDGQTASFPSTVELLTLGDIDPTPLIWTLSEAGVTAGGAEPKLLIVLVEDYLTPELESLNHQLLCSERGWMLVKPVGRKIWIGPAFHSRRTACWACLAARLRLNRQVEEFVRNRRPASKLLNRPLAELPGVAGLAAGLAALEIARFLAGDRWIENRIAIFDVIPSAGECHKVIKRPQCSACGDPDQFRAPRSIVLSRVAKPHLGSGIHRSITAESTVDKLEDHISSVTGVVSWVADSPAAGHGLSYNVAAGHNFVIGAGTVEWLHRSLSIPTGGKGTSSAEAKASAIGEAVERYSGVWRGEEPCIRSSFSALGEEAINPLSCMLFSARQYETRDVWNDLQTGSRRHSVPQPFDDSAVLDWTPAWSLTHERFRYFPSSFCYYGHPDSASHFFCSADSNGCAAGNTLPEALVSGFLELVERDAVAMWWYNRAQRPGVDLESFDFPYLKRLKAYYRSLHREIWAIDVTTDLGIPTFVALSRRTDRRTEDIIFGFGAHLEPGAALMHAVNELNQFLPAVSREHQDGTTIYAWPEAEAIDWWRSARVENDHYLLPDAGKTAMRKETALALQTNDVREDVLKCVEMATRIGLEVFVLDQSRPDIPMAVCRVIVPGMRHFWRRLAAGRLYDVPVALGWLDRAVKEEDLNPYSIFI